MDKLRVPVAVCTVCRSPGHNITANNKEPSRAFVRGNPNRLKFLVVSALASFGILASCTRPHDASSDSKKVQPPESEREAATVSQQKMCTEQAKKSFEGSAFSKDNTNTYTSHYDTRTNICYVEVASRPTLATNIFSYNLLVYDAFEGRPYGELSELYSPEQVVKCRVTPRGAQREITCKSLEEFNGLVLKYFGVTPN